MADYVNDATLELGEAKYKTSMVEKITGRIEEIAGKIKNNPSQIAEGKQKRLGTFQSMYAHPEELDAQGRHREDPERKRLEAEEQSLAGSKASIPGDHSEGRHVETAGNMGTRTEELRGDHSVREPSESHSQSAEQGLELSDVTPPLSHTLSSTSTSASSIDSPGPATPNLESVPPGLIVSEEAARQGAMKGGKRSALQQEVPAASLAQ